MLLEGNLSLDALAATVLLTELAIQPVQRILVLWQQYQSIPVAKKSIESLQSFPLEKLKEISNSHPLEIKGDILLKNFSL
ncbi:hypothetical protein [Candidatus Coxiella mudrowiae]|uniref:hypothetical protein n=1 Tax=Candidatus Coxiella mudrowiae TaxID=2054173 RepID=UPI000A4BC720|nr:hypothetical protein [Candidatus Coxiella mudrowiae]